MEIDDGKRLILAAFCELAWADGKVEQAHADYISEQAEQMDLPLGSWLPDLVMGLTRPPTDKITKLSEVPIDDVERYQVTERFVALCLLGEAFTSKRAKVLADLALQLGIRAKELEEMRRRLC